MNSKEHISAIILAAGLSSRMGSPKQLLQIHGQTMLDHAVEAALGAGIEKPIVVLGHNAAEIRSQTKLLHHCNVVINNFYKRGMSTSLICGVEAAVSATGAYIFMLSDQPLVSSTLIQELLGEYEKKEADILYPTYQGRRGNPAIISSKLRKRLLEARGDSGARFLFNDQSLNIIKHPVSTTAVVIDIDTPEDLCSFKKFHLFDKNR